MPAAHDLWLFAAASIALLVAPGPAVGYVIAQSAEHGARFGIAASAGNVTGGILHVVAAIAGLGTPVWRAFVAAS